ncbi:MAG: leucine-rich repeat domain-containing protein, partial [Sodaliphilus sp.]
TVDGCNEIPSLDCSGNLLSELNVKNCAGLSSLKCNNNRLQTLSIDNLPKIETLNCSSNYISNLSIANCEKLTTLNCENNRLTNFSIINTPSLQSINCRNNALQNLDVVKELGSLTYLDCSSNPLTSLIFNDNQTVTTVNFSNCKDLESFPTLPTGIIEITCSRSPIIAKADLSIYPNLIHLFADSCELANFDASMCPNLEKLYLDGNHIMELDLSALTKLGSTVNDVHMNQEIRMPAVWRESEKKWEVTLPATFNISRLSTIGAAYLSDGTSRVDVHGHKFYDENGILRFSIYSNQIKKVYGPGGFLVCPFYYYYNTYCPSLHIWDRDSKVGITAYQVASGVDDVTTAKMVSTVRYYDLQGHESAEPFPGFNIEVTHFTDGTTQSQKFVK